MALRSPPPEIPVITFASPNKGDLGLIEFWNTELASYVQLDLGAPHPNTRLYPGFVLGIQQALEGDEKWVKRVWVQPATNEDWFNYQIKYSAESDAFPIFIRTYQVAKATYAPLAKGTKLGTLYRLIVTDGGSGYTPDTFPALTFSNGSAQGYGVVGPDGIVSEFIISDPGSGYTTAPTFTVEDPPVGLDIGTVAQGTAFIQPTGAILVHEEAGLYPEGSELNALYFQVSRVYETIPGPVLTERRFDDHGIAHTIETQLTLSGAVTPVADEVTDQRTEPRDTVVDKFTDDAAAKFFEDKSFKREIPDLTPIEFRALISTVTTGERVVGTAALPSLAPDELERTQHQYTEFLKDTTLVERGAVSLPVSLVDTETTGDKQVRTVTKTLEVSGTSTTVPDEVTDVAVKQIGDGRELETVGTVPDVFPRQEFRIDIPDPIPLRFRTLIPTATSSDDEAGIAVMPVLGAGDLAASETQKDEFVKRVSHTNRAALSLPVTLIGYKLTPDKQIETITETIDDTIQNLSGISATTYEAEVTNLGNNMSILVDGEVPDVFGGAVFQEEIPDPIPQRFRVVAPTATTELTTAGTAADPTLNTGDLSITETQVDEFKVRTRTVTRAGISLPVSLVSYKLTPDQQIETVTETLDSGLQTITGVTATTAEAEVQNLGNNTSLLTDGEVPDVFGAERFAINIPDPIPQRFRVVAPTSTTAVTSAGAATAPSLGTGDLEITDEQTTEFKHRLSTTTRSAVSLPVSLISYKLTPDKQIETVTETLDTGLQTITGVSALTAEAEVQNLGNNTSLLTDGEVPSVFGAEVFAEEIPDPIPQRFRVVAPTATIGVTAAGTASDPTLGTGDLSIRETQLDEFKFRTETVTRSAVSLPVSLVSYKYTADQQVETMTETLDTGLQTITGAALTVEASVDNLGNNTSLKGIGTVPSVFAETAYSIEIPDPIPARFRVVAPATTTALTASGSAAAPSLGVGDLSASDKDLTEFKHRSSVTTRSAVSLPVSLTSYKYTRDGQVETFVETLDTGLQTITGSALTVEADVQNLGNSTSLKGVGTVPTVFEGRSSSREIADLIPREFQAVVPTFTIESTVAGAIVDPPVFSTGDLRKTEVQITEFAKKITTVTRAGISLPVTLTGGQKLVEKYGVQLLADEVITLGTTGTLTIPTGSLVIEAEKKEIGGGMEIATSLVATNSVWPVLTSRPFDEEMQVRTVRDEQIVAPTYTPVDGVGFTESLRAIDSFHSRRIRVTKVPTAVSEATAIVSSQSAPYQFPGTLNAAQGAVTNGWLGHRATQALLVEHTIKTWWVNSATKPVIPFDEIIMDTVVVVGVNRIVERPNVLHDDYFAFGAYTQFFPATTPSYTEYYLGVPSGSTTSHNSVTLYNIGSGYTSGNTITVPSDSGPSASIRVTSVGIVGPGEITSYEILSEGVGGIFTNPVAGSGGSGSGAEFNVFPFSSQNFIPGTAWIGTPRVVSANVTPTDIKNQWKIVTRTIVMR